MLHLEVKQGHTGWIFPDFCSLNTAAPTFTCVTGYIISYQIPQRPLHLYLYWSF